MGDDKQHTVDGRFGMIQIAFEHDVNLVANAEIYGNGQAEKNMGDAIRKGIAKEVWNREDLVITTKLFNGFKGF